MIHCLSLTWLQGYFGDSDVKFLLLSMEIFLDTIVRTPAIYGISVWISDFSFQGPETQAHKQVLPHSNPGNK
jgi:hypothetical protein